MEFPQFDGKDVLVWLFRCEKFFKIYQTPEENKVKLASIHLDDKVYQWHRALERRLRGHLPIWKEYAILLQNNFGPPFKTPLGDLRHLRQTGDLAEFNADFDWIAAKIDLPEDYLADVYISALKPQIEGPVRMFNPRTVIEARRLARMQEVILKKFKIQSQWVSSPSFNAQIASVNKSKGQYNYKNTFLPSGLFEKPIQPIHKAKTEAWAPKQSFRPSKIFTPEKEEADHQSKPMARSTDANSNSQAPMDRSPPLDSVAAYSGSSLVLGISPLPSLVSVLPASSPTLDNHASSKEVPLESRSSGSDCCEGFHLLLPTSSSTSKQAGEFLQFKDFPKQSEEMAWQVKEHAKRFTWLASVKFEKSSYPLQLAACKKYGGVMCSGYKGFVLEKMQRIFWTINRTLICHQLPTLCLKQTWFKGSLIEMLIGSSLVPCLIYYFDDKIQWSKACHLRQSYIVGKHVYSAYGGSQMKNWRCTRNRGSQLAAIFWKEQIFLFEFNGLMDLFFQDLGPRLLQSGYISYGLNGGFSNWALPINSSPTRIMLQIWFKGELILMLIGRFCSLSGKDKKKVHCTVVLTSS